MSFRVRLKRQNMIARQRILGGLLACLCAAACIAPAQALSNFTTVAEALTSKNLTILLAAVEAAGIDVQPGTAWTILAPTNFAFADRLNKTFGITPADLLLPESRDTLTAVLAYHVIPGAAVLSSQLQDGQEVPTALQGAVPLTVKLRCNKIDFEGARNDARVQKADIQAGSNIVVHVVDDVLLPEL
ncbi:fasciclin domain protein [Scenedesmus sp. NREL 46B-D3]|nr:fasciclin domain protein [Scenedesmus sp. NREL 46B-D3]